jgi:hypothetical protein
MPTLFLIDAYAQFFRHYHAIRTPMSSPVTKEPTNMTFGFVGLLLRLLGAGGDARQPALWSPPGRQARPTSPSRSTSRMTAARSAPSFTQSTRRRAPHRPKTSPRRSSRCLAILRSHRRPRLSASPAFEADDVIATLVEHRPAESVPAPGAADGQQGQGPQAASG